MIRAVFMGSDLFSVIVLDILLRAGEQLEPPTRVVGVVTQPDRPSGRGRKASPNFVKVKAVESRVPALQPERIRSPDAVASVLAWNPDVVIVASYGQIVPDSLLKAPPLRCLNLHPSLLPRYRGPSPIQAPILEGDRETGATLMLMTSRLDAGPIIDQETTEMDPLETAGELGQRLARLSAELLLRDLPDWAEGCLKARPQDESRATYTSRISKEEGLVDWTLPASSLARRVLAFNPWPTAYTFWDGRLLRLLRARPAVGKAEPGQVSGMRDGAIAVGTGDGLLLVDELQLAGRKPLAVAEFQRGHPEFLRSRLSPEPAWSSV
jgi:methionyl-tRNA formyltransferase